MAFEEFWGLVAFLEVVSWLVLALFMYSQYHKVRIKSDLLFFAAFAIMAVSSAVHLLFFGLTGHFTPEDRIDHMLRLSAAALIIIGFARMASKPRLKTEKKK